MFLSAFGLFLAFFSFVGVTISQDSFDDSALPPEEIFPFNHTIPNVSPYKRFQPYWVIQRGCGPFAARNLFGCD